VGYAAMEKKRKEGAENKLISLTLDDETAVPIGGEPIYLSDQIIGQITSCAFGFRIGKPIALGHLKEMVSDNSTVYVDIARQLYSARVSIGPLFDADGLRIKS
jgi:4-methylaminobutanoate oxidase (formaldehyde-forming)